MWKRSINNFKAITSFFENGMWWSGILMNDGIKIIIFDNISEYKQKENAKYL